MRVICPASWHNHTGTGNDRTYLFFYCLFNLGGSEEKEPGEDQHKEEDASGSQEGQTESSSRDGKTL